jgi:hypothetical protein
MYSRKINKYTCVLADTADTPTQCRHLLATIFLTYTVSTFEILGCLDVSVVRIVDIASKIRTRDIQYTKQGIRFLIDDFRSSKEFA